MDSVTVVVLELAGGEVLERCLTAASKLDLPTAVICRKKDSLLTDKYQQMTFLHLDAPLPVRRQHALEQINSDIIVLIEDTTLPGVSLKEELMRIFNQP